MSAATLGRQIAAAQGFDTSDPRVDWTAYGRAAEYRLGKRQPIPTPEQFLKATAPVHPPSTGRRGLSPPPPPPRPLRRSVQFGVLELSFADPARTSRQHARRRGERTTGRFRHRDTPHRHGHGRA